jgi:hypothetical protein
MLLKNEFSLENNIKLTSVFFRILETLRQNLSFHLYNTLPNFSLLYVQVKWWITIKERKLIATGYNETFGIVPNILTPGHGQYLAVHTALLSHVRDCRLYKREFKDKQGGEYCAL